jgi:hypothetical protein
MKAQDIFAETATMMSTIAPPSIRIGSLNGTHANFADLDDDPHVKLQVRWRPPKLSVCMVFEHTTDPHWNDTTSDRVFALFDAETRAGLLQRNPHPQLRVLEYIIPVDEASTATELARTTTIALLFFLERATGSISAAPSNR